MRKFFKQATATALSAAMIVSMAMVAPVTAVAEETEKAEPFWSVDFNNGFADLGVEGKDYTIVDNGAAPELVTEVVDGTEIQVLKLNKSSGSQINGVDYWGKDMFFGYENNSTIEVKNPFAILGEDYFTEYTPYQDLIEENLVQKYNGKKQPIWTKGATINYWIYVPEAEGVDGQNRTVGINSSVFTWNLRDAQFQADDYAKYLTCHYFDIEQEQLKAENPDAVYNESGVPETSKYWFEFKKDADGNVIYYEDAVGNKGPVYGTSSEKARFGEHFWMNPNYIQGFTGNDESNYSFMSYEPNYYTQGYNILPEYNEETGQWDFSNGSKVRVANTHGALQIDSNNSMFWNNDNSRGINLNTNLSASYGSRAGMQNGDCFFIHSWQESATGSQTADSALYLADSPYSEPGAWHMVTATFQNDWVEFYMDGEMVDVESTYSSRGGVSIDKGESFKRFNKGTGMRYGYGSEKNMGDMYYGNYVCRLFLDWLTNPETTFTIGGVCVADGDANMYVMSQVTDEIKIAKIDFYGVVMDEDQIAAKYAEGMVSSFTYGDVDENGVVEAADALETLKAVVKLTTLSSSQEKAADVDGKAGIEAADALSILQYVVKLIDKFPVEG